MIKIEIPEKIVDEQLMNGKKIKIQYFTRFNSMMVEKVFPNDFTPEQQLIFKQVYEDAVYGSEVGNKIFRCFNAGNTISISGYKRIAATELGIEDFTVDQIVKLKFTRYALGVKSAEMGGVFNSNLSAVQLLQLNELGIIATGLINEFEIQSFDGDISVEVIKEDVDSFIDLGEFIQGKLIFQK